MKNVIFNVGGWIFENRIIIALVISEMAALTPGKYKGILQGTMKVISAIRNKKSSKS